MKKKNPSLLMSEISNKINTIETKIDKIEIAVAKLEQAVKNHNRLLWFLLVLIISLLVKLAFGI